MRQKAVIIISIIIGFIGAVIISSERGSEVYAQNLQEGIAGEILRFHVLANSDSDDDQELKVEVKNYIVDYMREMLAEADSLEETKKIVAEHLEEITEAAQQVVYTHGYDYDVSASLRNLYFPVKTYGDCTFPAGNYEALQIEIGAAQGKNWWCVLYPNLCFVDAVHAVVPEESKQELKNVLTEEEYGAITGTGSFKIKFRISALFGGSE